MIIHNRLISSVNGPGRRAVIWFQGCSLSCRGCWNVTTHTFDKPDNEDYESLARWILEQKDIDGVTFSGGEPMQQADDLLNLIVILKMARPNLSIGMYTGYTEEELNAGKFKYRTVRYELDHDEVIWVDDAPKTSMTWAAISGMIDFAVAGRFQDSKITNLLPLRSSTNQKLLLFGDRYKESDFAPQMVEVVISASSATVTGFPIGVKGL